VGKMIIDIDEMRGYSNEYGETFMAVLEELNATGERSIGAAVSAIAGIAHTSLRQLKQGEDFTNTRSLALSISSMAALLALGQAVDGNE
jgi:hypothetical protein